MSNHLRLALAVPVTSPEPIFSDDLVLAVPVGTEELSRLLELFRVYRHVEQAAADAEGSLDGVTMASSLGSLYRVPELTTGVAGGGYEDVRRSMADVEMNVVLDLRRLDVGEPVGLRTGQRIKVRGDDLEWSGFYRRAAWSSSAVWRGALLVALMHLAPEDELPGLLDELAQCDPWSAADILRRGIRPDGPSDFRRPAPMLSTAARGILLAHEDRDVRLAASAAPGWGRRTGR